MHQRKTSILVDAHVFDKEPQGTKTYIIGLYTEFIKKYSHIYDVYFTANDVSALAVTFPMLDRDRFISLKKCSPPERLFVELPRLIKKNKFDYAHFQQIAPLIKTGKYIVTIHDLLFNEFEEMFSRSYRMSRNYLFKKALKMSDIRLTVSDYSRDSIKRIFNIDDVYVTDNAVSPKYFDDYDKSAAETFVFEKYGVKKYLLFTSRIEKRKNHLMLLKAYRELRLSEQGISLVFVGRNDIPFKPLEDEIASLTADEKKHFFWFQYVDDADLFEIYKAASMFVYPSLAEGFGIPPIEAGALKINTMCSNLTAMKDFVFFNGNQFDPRDYKSFVEKLKNNLATPPVAERLATISNQIKLKYNWSNGADLLHHLIQKDITGAVL